MIRAALVAVAVLLAAAICVAVATAERERASSSTLPAVSSAVRRAELVISPREPTAKETLAAVTTLRSKLSSAARNALSAADVAGALRGAKLVLERDDSSAAPSRTQSRAAAAALRKELRQDAPSVSQIGGGRMAVIVGSAIGLLAVAAGAAVGGAFGRAPVAGGFGQSRDTGERDRDALALACVDLADALDGHDNALVQRLEYALQRGGVQRLAAGSGDAFDPTVHHAAGAVATSEAALDGRVAGVVRAGWTAGGCVLRPAQVTVYRRDGG